MCPYGECRRRTCQIRKLPLPLLPILVRRNAERTGVSLAAKCGSRRAYARLAADRIRAKIEVCRALGFALPAPRGISQARQLKALSCIRWGAAISSYLRKSFGFNSCLPRGSGSTASPFSIERPSRRLSALPSASRIFIGRRRMGVHIKERPRW